jgi:hypothetical protein
LDWYGNGDVDVTFSDEERVFRTTAATADSLRSTAPNMAAVVLGRRLFDLTNGWNGRPANGERAFVVTHAPPTGWAHLDAAPFTFVTDGVRSAIEQSRASAGERRPQHGHHPDARVPRGDRRRVRPGAARGRLLLLAASTAVLLALGFYVWAQRRGDPT